MGCEVIKKQCIDLINLKYDENQLYLKYKAAKDAYDREEKAFNDELKGQKVFVKEGVKVESGGVNYLWPDDFDIAYFEVVSIKHVYAYIVKHRDLIVDDEEDSPVFFVKVQDLIFEG